MNNDMKSNVFSDENDIFNSGNSQSSNSNTVGNPGTLGGSNTVSNPSNVGTPSNMSNSSNVGTSNGNINPNQTVSPKIENNPGNFMNMTNGVIGNPTTNQGINPSNQTINTQNISQGQVNQTTQQNSNTNQIPVNNDLVMPKLNGDETIGTMKKDTQKSPVAMLILFVVLILSVFLIPQITPYFSELLKIFNIDDNSSIYDNNRKDNTTDNKDNTNKDQDKTPSEDEVKTTYYEINPTTEISFKDLKITRMTKGVESTNYYLSYKIINNGDTSYSFKDHKIYFDFYNDTNTYLGRILIDTDVLASKEEITLKSLISENEYNNMTKLEVLERNSSDYQSVTLKNNKLTCTNSNHSIIYTFNSNNLVGLEDTFNYTFTVNDKAYAKYSLETQNQINELNKMNGVSAGFVNRETGFTKTVRIDYSVAEEDFTKYDRVYYKKNELASTINYELESIGYQCD